MGGGGHCDSISDEYVDSYCGSRQEFGPAFLKASLQGDQPALHVDDVCSWL
jgi:hypothetical protein